MTADTYHITDRKERTTKISGIQRQSVLDFCHSDEGSSIDSNLHKVVTINNVDHAARVWSVMTVNEQYELFKQSDIVEEFTRLHSNYVTPLRTFFTIIGVHVFLHPFSSLVLIYTLAH